MEGRHNVERVVRYIEEAPPHDLIAPTRRLLRRYADSGAIDCSELVLDEEERERWRDLVGEIGRPLTDDDRAGLMMYLALARVLHAWISAAVVAEGTPWHGRVNAEWDRMLELKSEVSQSLGMMPPPSVGGIGICDTITPSA